MGQAIELMDKIDELKPKMFCYHLYMDDSRTGNFEVTLHLQEPSPDSSDFDLLIHSKKSSGQFPLDDFDKFQQNLENQITSNDL